MTNPVSPHPCQYLMLSLFWILAVLMYACSEISLWLPSPPTVALICISLMIILLNNLGYLCLFSLHIFSLVKCSVHVFFPFSNWIASFFTLAFWVLCLYPRYQFFYRYMTSKYFLPVLINFQKSISKKS